DDGSGREAPAIKVQRGDTLARILAKLGAQAWQVRAMVEATRSVMPESALVPGFEIRAVVVPAPARPPGDLVRFSIYDENGGLKVTLPGNGRGEYAPSATRRDDPIAPAALSDNDRLQDNSLYTSFYFAAAKQGVPSDLIMQVMRIHAYGTDFR